MKAILALAVLCMFSQAHGQAAGQAAGQVVMASGEVTKYCQDCVNFFTDLHELISSTNTTAEIEQLVKQMICSQLGSLRSMCSELVDMYVPLALQYVSSLEKPKQVCGFLGMCHEKWLEHIKLKARERSEECDLCKTVVTELKSFVREQGTQDEIKDFIENNVCPLLGSLAGECKQEVDTYAALVFQVIVNELDPVVVCETFGLCNQTKKMLSLSRVGLTSSATKVKVIHSEKSKVMMPKKLKGEQCVICEFAMKEIDQLLENKKTEAEIEAALDKVCSFLPSTISTECTAFVDQYGPLIIKLLVQDISPDQVCEMLGLCQKKVTVRADPKCVLCEFVMGEIDDLIGNNRSQASVEAALEKVCGLMPETISEECKQFVDEYGPAVINLIIEELDPKEVCKTLRLCTSEKHAAVKKTAQRKMKASPECVICEYVINELDTILGDNRTEQSIKQALDQVCGILPSTVRDTCVDFINTYSPAIVELLVQELDPSAVCTTLGLCSTPAMKKRMLHAKPLKDSEGCQLCVTVLTYVDELMKENSTVQEVKDLLEKVCNFLPTDISPQCDQFVDAYAGLVLNLIGNDMDPRQICEQIGLCTASGKAWELKNNRLFFKPSNLGTKECTYGPAYWCDSKENAIKCGAMEHCMKHVWN